MIRGGPGQIVEKAYRRVNHVTIPGGAEDVLLDFGARSLIKKAKKAQKQFAKLSKL